MTKSQIPIPKSQFRAQRGMTLIEASIILSVVAILSAVMAPSINGYIDQAREARVRADVRTISDAIQQFIADNAEHQFLRDANGAVAKEPPARGDINKVWLLVSDGDIPALANGETFWTQEVNNAEYDTLSNHLIENLPGEASARQYRNPTDITLTSVGGQNIDFARTSSSGFNAPYAWRGPYLRGPVDPDPWGNRYAVNVAFLDPAPTAAITSVITAGFAPTTDYARLDVFVLSAGADEEIDTASAQDGAVPGDDDVIEIVSSHAK